MELHYLPRTGTLLWEDGNGIKVSFQCFEYGDVLIMYSIISRMAGGIDEAFPHVLAWCAERGFSRIEGYVEPYMFELLSRIASAVGVKVIQTDTGRMDGKEMVWVKIYPP